MTVEIPGYRILSTLGKGGMATVYLAEHEIFQRKVALKVMAPGLADDPSFGQRFMREARIVSQLVHPNIVTVYDVGVHEGNYYLSMEYIDGKDLKHARRQLTLEQKVLVILDIAKALSYAGDKGYVHRDIKPENIMLYTHDGRAVLTDFGIARAAELDTVLTQTGTAIGTPHYMSPEQAKGQSVDLRADIYSLGVVFYLLLVGYVPFDAESAVAIGIKHITEPIPELPQGLERLQPVINRMLAKLPNDRYQNGNELVRDLQRLDLTSLTTTAADAQAHAEASLAGDADAPTVVSRPQLESANATDAEQEPTPLLVNEPFVVEEDGNSLWPWLAGILVLLTVAGGVYYSQYLAQTGDPLPVETAEETASPAASATEEVSTAPPSVEPPATVDLDAATGDEQSDAGPEARIAELRQEVADRAAALEEEGGSLAPLLDVWHALEQLEAVDTDARDRVTQALAAEVDRIDALARAGEVKVAQQRFERLAAQVPSSVDIDLSTLEQTLAQQTRIQELVQEGYRLLEQDRLTQPADENARARFEQALALDADNRRAEEGLAAVVERLAQLGDQALEQGNSQRAESLLRRAAEIAPNSAAVTELRSGIEADRRAQRDREMANLLEQAEAQLEEAAYFTPVGDSAYDYFQQVLERSPNNAAAQAGVERTLRRFEARLLNLLAEDHTEAVRELLAKARERLPEHPELAAIETRVEAAIEEHLAATRPRVTAIDISGSQGAADADSRQSVIQAGRSLFVNFQYENFEGETNLLQAVLMDGSRSVQIAQVPVVISGAGGTKSFRIDRPVDGFPAGRYSIDLLYDDRALVAQDFEVE